jgi:hypothetical protein
MRSCARARFCGVAVNFAWIKHDSKGYRAAERAVPEVLESQHSVVKLKDLQTGEETFVAFRPGE